MPFLAGRRRLAHVIDRPGSTDGAIPVGAAASSRAFRTVSRPVTDRIRGPGLSRPRRCDPVGCEKSGRAPADSDERAPIAWLVFFSVVYVVVCRLLQLIVLGAGPNADRDLELLVIRHENAVLRR